MAKRNSKGLKDYDYGLQFKTKGKWNYQMEGLGDMA